MRHALFVLIFAAALPVLRGYGGEAKFETPEKAFEAYEAAVAAKDWKGMLACMDAESRDTTIGAMVILAQVCAAGEQGAPDADKTKNAFSALLKKHNIEAMKMDEFVIPNTPDAIKKLRANAAAKVKDKPAFMEGFTAAMGSVGDKAESPLQDKSSHRLKDVKIDGDSATAKVVVREGATEKESGTETFKKVGDGWLLHIKDK